MIGCRRNKGRCFVLLTEAQPTPFSGYSTTAFETLSTALRALCLRFRCQPSILCLSSNPQCVILIHMHTYRHLYSKSMYIIYYLSCPRVNLMPPHLREKNQTSTGYLDNPPKRTQTIMKTIYECIFGVSKFRMKFLEFCTCNIFPQIAEQPKKINRDAFLNVVIKKISVHKTSLRKCNLFGVNAIGSLTISLHIHFECLKSFPVYSIYWLWQLQTGCPPHVFDHNLLRVLGASLGCSAQGRGMSSIYIRVDFPIFSLVSFFRK